MKIYGDIQSGNCYKVKLLCALLDIDREWVEVDILAGDTKKPESSSVHLAAINGWASGQSSDSTQCTLIMMKC